MQVNDHKSYKFVKDENSFHNIALALSEFFNPDLDIDEDEKENNAVRTSVKNLIFPCLKNRFLPPKSLCAHVQRIMSTEEAFKKFGRC